MNIFNNKNFKILTIVFFLNFFAKNLFAFGGSMAGGSMGGGSMGGGGMGGGMGGSGNSGPKSGISIVDPLGKSYNCQPFVDQKWESTNFEDSWNGVYFSVGAEISKFSGDFKITDSKIGNVSVYNPLIPYFSEEKRNFNFSGQSTTPFATVGGGMILNNIYLATDLEIRASEMSSTVDVIINEINNNSSLNKTNIKSKMNYSMKNYIMYNAKIGYLIHNRSLIYFNAGLGSFSSYEISMKDYSIKTDDTSSPPPIRLSIGSEFALSNHFRLYGDFSHWIIPQVQGDFTIQKNGSSQGMQIGTDVSFNSKINVQSFKFGVLYRF